MRGLLHLDAALAPGAQADRNTAATHLAEASALVARMDTEVAMELREPGQALDATVGHLTNQRSTPRR